MAGQDRDEASASVWNTAVTRAAFLRASGVAVAGVAIPWWLAACGGGATNPTPTPALHPTLRVPGGDFGLPSPYGFVKGPGYWRMSLLFDTLVWTDGSGNFIPWLATSWSTPDGGKTWRFRLRDNVRWQDGTPLTAADVAFTFQYLTQHPQPASVVIGRPQLISSATAVDATTVEVVLMRPYAPFLNRNAGAVPIVPQHIWSSVSDPAHFTGPQATIGSGPFKLESYSGADGTYLYTANDTFFLGKPFVRRIELRPVGDPLLAVQKGDLDAGGTDPPQVPAKSTLDSFRSQPAYGVIQGAPDLTLALYFNMKKGGALADVHFRRAIAFAVNRPDMVNRLLQGLGVPGNASFLPPSNPWYNANVERYPFSVQQANAELDAGGYQLVAGMRRTPSGAPLSFSISFASTSSRAYQLLAGYLNAVGIQTQPLSADQGTQDARTTSGDYEMALLVFGGLGGDPDYMRTVFAGPPGPFQAVQGYTNPTFTQLAQQQVGILDQSKRRPLVDQMQQILAQDVAALPLYYPYGYTVFRKQVFDAWYYTPGGFAGGVPLVYNKQAFVTGAKTGTSIRARLSER